MTPEGPREWDQPEGWEPGTSPGGIPKKDDRRYGARSTYRDIPERNFLADVRLASGLTTQQVADELGITTAAVSQMMAPGNDARMSTIRKFISACDGQAYIVVELPLERMKIII